MISWFTFIFFISFVACCYHRVFFNFRLFHGWRFSESSGVLWYSGISCEGCGGPLTVRPACNKLSYKTTFAGCLIGIVFSARKKVGRNIMTKMGGLSKRSEVPTADTWCWRKKYSPLNVLFKIKQAKLTAWCFLAKIPPKKMLHENAGPEIVKIKLPTFNGFCWRTVNNYPIGFMYGIFTDMFHQNHPNVGRYTIHGSYGYDTSFTYGTEDADKKYCTLWLFLEVKNSALVRWLQKTEVYSGVFSMFHRHTDYIFGQIMTTPAANSKMAVGDRLTLTKWPNN